jgi:hypothetical protein
MTEKNKNQRAAAAPEAPRLSDGSLMDAESAKRQAENFANSHQGRMVARRRTKAAPEAPRKRYVVYTDSMLEEVEATFASKSDLLAYGEKHQTNADAVVKYDKRNPDGYVFLGWDEIEQD